MKKVILSVAVIAITGLMSCKHDAKTKMETVEHVQSDELSRVETAFGVRGNCVMCKQTIEKAANGVEGVITATWDVNRKAMTVVFDGSKTDEMAFHNAIAASGYDTERVAGNEEAYKNLPECCQYDHAMAMNQSGQVEGDNHAEHNHE